MGDLSKIKSSFTFFVLCDIMKIQTSLERRTRIVSKNNYAFLINHFSSHEIIYSESKDSVEIINSFGQDNIVVDYDVADPTPFMVMFSFQHRHIKDEKGVIEYITDIINENIFPIEFFKNGERRFGGDVTAQELKDLSYEKLEQKTGYYGSTKLIDCADAFKVRGWSGKNNFDATLVIGESGKIEIKKLN